MGQTFVPPPCSAAGRPIKPAWPHQPRSLAKWRFWMGSFHDKPVYSCGNETDTEGPRLLACLGVVLGEAPRSKRGRNGGDWVGFNYQTIKYSMQDHFDR
jgi:hypothetical protein